ncbi:hypothetical protein AAEX28_04835 [Lentisphaerota bacterium WC36G]|nr:hypothetical protein LJT99_07215 [Lentisphaerae bacterium WC36]UDQ99414.1 hypothetical protein LJT99_07695 [Lentisphaerae bacterium WC36]
MKKFVVHYLKEAEEIVKKMVDVELIKYEDFYEFHKVNYQQREKVILEIRNNKNLKQLVAFVVNNQQPKDRK